MLINTVPILICWEIWRHRCSCKYGTQKCMRSRTMIQQVFKNIEHMIKKSFPNFEVPVSWIEMVEKVERLKAIQTVLLIHWTKPETGRMKLNTDGSFNINKSGIGGVLRDSEGQLVIAFSKPALCSTNIQAEASAAKTGLEWCLANGMTECDLEMDSKVIVDMLKDGCNKNLRLRPTIEELKTLVQQMNCRVPTLLQTDTLAKGGAKMECAKLYHNSQLAGLTNGSKKFLSVRQIPVT